MDVIYRLEYESSHCEHLDKRILYPDGSGFFDVDQLSTRGITSEVIRPLSGDDPHATVHLYGTGTITIEDQCLDGQCVAIIVKTQHIETTIYLPIEMSLTTLDAAICSAIMERRAREEGR
jgi:hypothetical protein